MIKKLIIKNFAIIDNMTVDFHKGFNVITGETGAGKSLIINAIDILLIYMAQAGLHAAVGYQMSRIVPYEKRLFPALIFGAMVPDLDIIVVAAASLFYTIPQAEDIFHRTFSHSLFTLIFVYLFFAINIYHYDKL